MYTTFYYPVKLTYREIQETLTFGWCLNEDSLVRYEVTFQNGADFWRFLYMLTKPLPHN